MKPADRCPGFHRRREERRHAEQQLREAHQRVRATLEGNQRVMAWLRANFFDLPPSEHPLIGYVTPPTTHLPSKRGQP